MPTTLAKLRTLLLRYEDTIFEFERLGKELERMPADSARDKLVAANSESIETIRRGADLLRSTIAKAEQMAKIVR
jgi:hypothetical protein